MAPRKTFRPCSNIAMGVERFFVAINCTPIGKEEVIMYRTHTCNELRLEDVGKKVKLAGFVQTIRDMGGFCFWICVTSME